VLIFVIFVKKNFLGIHPGFWGFVASLVSLVVISLMTPPSPKATVDRIHGVIGRIYHKSPDQLWYPTTGKGIFATLVVIAEVFAISYGLYYLKTERIILGMAAQYAWVLGWVLAALIAQFVLFKHVRIDENV